MTLDYSKSEGIGCFIFSIDKPLDCLRFFESEEECQKYVNEKNMEKANGS